MANESENPATKPDAPAPGVAAPVDGSAPGPEDLEIDDDTPITCWCGETGTYDELFDDSGLDRTCGGTGELQCHCGGDLCVCHHHGSCECPGCPDCEDQDDNDDYCDED